MSKTKFFLEKGKLRDLQGGDLHAEIDIVCKRYTDGECSRREFLRTVSLLGVSAGSAYAAIGVADPMNTAHAAVKKGGVLNMEMPVLELSDPALADWSEKANIFRHMIYYLTEVPADNVVRPALATSWKPNADLTEWTFNLNKKVRWSNGEKLTSKDVKATIDAWVAPDSKSSAKSLFSSVKNVKIINDHKFVLQLSKPSLTIPENCYHYPCAITHRDFRTKYGTDIKNPNVPLSGPYMLSEYKVGRKATLTRRKDYWGDDGYLDTINFIDLGKDFQAAVAALASGQVDLLYKLSINELNLIQKLPNAVLIRGQSANAPVIRMQVDKKPFDNPKVREAIVIATDNRAALKFGYRDLASLGENFHVAPFHPEYYKLPKMKRNISKAKKLLKEAGYPNGIDLEIALGNTQGTWEQDTAQVIKEQVAKAGIRIKLNVMPAEQYWPIWDKAPFSLTFWTHRPLGTMVLELAYRKGVAWNEVHYDNPKFDAALDRAIAIADPKKRSKVMKDVQSIVQNDHIMIQPFFPETFTASSKILRDFHGHPSTFHELSRVWLDT